jgi:SHS2 domain-containing protein
MGYRILDHTADIGIEVHGSNLSDLFSQAALALVDLLTDRALLTGATEKIVRIEGADLEDLWVNYLREILYLFNGESFLLQDVYRINFDNAPDPVGGALYQTEKSVAGEDDGNPIPTPTLPLKGREVLGNNTAVPNPTLGLALPIPDLGLPMKGREASEANTGTGLCLTAYCVGEIYKPRCHAIKTEIKAVTYHRAEVKQTPEGWQGVFIVDV